MAVEDVQVIILAGGEGRRLRPFTYKVPKPLVSLLGATLLDWQLGWLRGHGFYNIKLSLGYKADKITDYIKQRYPGIGVSVEDRPLDTGGGLKNTLQGVSGRCLVLNGDIITDFNLNRLTRAPADPRPEADKHSLIVGCRLEDTKDFGLLELDKNYQVVSFKEKQPGLRTDGVINAGIYMLNSADIISVPQERFSLERDVFPRLAARGSLRCIIHQGYWFDVGTHERLRSAEEFLRSRGLEYKS